MCRGKITEQTNVTWMIHEIIYSLLCIPSLVHNINLDFSKSMVLCTPSLVHNINLDFSRPMGTSMFLQLPLPLPLPLLPLIFPLFSLPLHPHPNVNQHCIVPHGILSTPNNPIPTDTQSLAIQLDFKPWLELYYS